jgi:hypothetical protein
VAALWPSQQAASERRGGFGDPLDVQDIRERDACSGWRARWCPTRSFRREPPPRSARTTIKFFSDFSLSRFFKKNGGKLPGPKNGEKTEKLKFQNFEKILPPKKIEKCEKLNKN